MAFEFVESRFPEMSIRLQPLEQFLQWLAAHSVKTALRFGASLDQARFFKDAQVLGDRGLADLELSNQVANRPFAIAKKLEDAATIWLGEDLEDRNHPLNIADWLYSCQAMISHLYGVVAEAAADRRGTASDLAI